MEATIEQDIEKRINTDKIMQVVSLTDILPGDTLLLSENHGQYYRRFLVEAIDSTSKHFIQFTPQIESLGIAGYEILKQTGEGLIYKGSASTPSVGIRKDELSQGILYVEPKRMIPF